MSGVCSTEGVVQVGGDGHDVQVVLHCGIYLKQIVIATLIHDLSEIAELGSMHA